MDDNKINKKIKPQSTEKRRLKGLDQSGSAPTAYFRNQNLKKESNLLFPPTDKE